MISIYNNSECNNSIYNVSAYDNLFMLERLEFQTIANLILSDFQSIL